jgi:hypothetical protein
VLFGIAALHLIASTAAADIIVFRNVAGIPIRFSLRDTRASEPVTEILDPGGRIQFDLPTNGRFDICATALDDLGGVFGETGVALPALLARMIGNEVPVDGIIRNGRRQAILLTFPVRGRLFKRRCRDLVVTVGPASNEFVQWFYYGKSIRDRY